MVSLGFALWSSSRRGGASFSIFLLGSLYAATSFAMAGNVMIQQSYKASGLNILTCEAETVPGASSSIYFHCPHVSEERHCFEDCTLVCNKPDCKILRDISCKKRTTGNTIRISLVLNNHVKAGKWYCQYRGTKSSPISYEPPPPPKPKPTKKTTTTTTTTTTKKPIVIVPPKKPPKKKIETGDIDHFTDVPVHKPKWRPRPKPVEPVQQTKTKYVVVKERKPQKNKTQFWTELTSPQLVIIVLALLGTSLVVNVAFCIRCILVKKYIDKYRRGVSDTTCLERCLCLPKARLRPGYKEDLYEDISSTPRVVYSPPGSAKSSGAEREDSLEFQSLARSRAYSPSSHRSHNPASRVGDIYATVVRGPRRQSAGGRYYSPQPSAVASQRVYDDVPESRSLSDIYARPQKLRPPPSTIGGASSSSAGSSSSARQSPDSAGTPSTLALKRVSEHPCEEEEDEIERDQEGEMIEACTRNNTRLELSKTLLHRADTLLREAGVLLD